MFLFYHVKLFVNVCNDPRITGVSLGAAEFRLQTFVRVQLVVVCRVVSEHQVASVTFYKVGCHAAHGEPM